MKKKQIALSLLTLATLTACGNPSVAGSSSATSSSDTSSVTSQESSQKVTAYAITADIDEGATIAGLPSEAKEGDTVRFTLSLQAEKKVSYVTMDGENVLEADADGYYSFVMPAHAVTVKAVTEDIRYALSVEQTEGATVALSSTWAKKGEDITVRVTISDPNKASPVVHAGEDEVTMAVVGDPTYKTFEGTFKEPGKDLKVSVTLTNASAKLSIQDKAGDGAKVDGPTAAASGETVTFSITLNPGVEAVGLPVVSEVTEELEGATVPVTALENGSYSFVMPNRPVVISQQTKNSIFKINASVEKTEELTGQQELTLGKDILVPEYAVYQGEATIEVTENNAYVVDQVLVDNEPIEKGENGYVFTMPSHEVAVKVVVKPRLYALEMQNSTHIQLSAYVKNAEGAYVAAPAEGINITQQVYVKANAEEGYGVDTIEMVDGTQTRELSLNEDGYYENVFAKPKSKDQPTLTFAVTEAAVILHEGDALLGTHDGLVASSSSYGGNYSNPKAFSLSEIGKGKFGYVDEVQLKNYDTTNKTFLLDNGSGSYYHGAYYDSGLIWVYGTSNSSESSLSMTSFTNVNFYLAGGEEVTTKEILSDNNSNSSATKSLVHLKGATHDAYAYVSISGSYSKTVTVSEATVTYKNSATKLGDTGAVLEVTVAGTTSYYQNNNGLLASYTKGEKKTYTGEYGSIAVDGFGNATITKDGNVSNANYSLNGSLMILTTSEETLYLKLASDNTYTKFNYATGKLIGASLSSSTSFGYLTLGDGFQAGFSTYSSYTPTLYGINVNADGTFYTRDKDEWFVLSPDGKSAIYRYSSSSIYFLSTRVDTGATSHCEINVLWNNDKTSMLATLRNNSTYSQDKSYVSVYYDGTSYIWGTLDAPENLMTDGSSLSFTKEDGAVLKFQNSGGKLIDESKLDGLQGTYTSGTDTLVLDGAGTATYKGDAGTYTVDASDANKIKLVVGTTTYDVTLDKTAKTFTATAEAAETYKKTVEITSSTEKNSTLKVALNDGDSYAEGDKVLLQISGINNTIYYKGSVACTYALYKKGDRSTVLASGTCNGSDSTEINYSFESSESYDLIFTVTAASTGDISYMIERSSSGDYDYGDYGDY